MDISVGVEEGRGESTPVYVFVRLLTLQRFSELLIPEKNEKDISP
jgi:hypothetical protein